MDRQSYSVYVHNRPIRTGFLVDSGQDSHAQIDAIIEYNHGRWGGRYNPVVITNGRTITRDAWELLWFTDPDVIKSFAILQKNLVRRIADTLSPYNVDMPARQRQPEEQYWFPSISDAGISILPTPAAVLRLVGSDHRKSRIISFKFGNEPDRLLQRFVKQNFGSMDMGTYYERQFGANEISIFDITSIQDFAAALGLITTFESMVFPSQLCAIPDDFPDTERPHADEKFTVIVGDTPEDRVWAWNRTLCVPKWKRRGLNQVWLPTTLCNAVELREPLRKWLSRVGGTEQGYSRVQLTSLSLSERYLESIASELRTGSSLIITSKAVTSTETPHRLRYLPVPGPVESLDHYELPNGEGIIDLTEPDVPQGQVQGEHWMADVYIRMRSGEHEHFYNKENWYQLPLRNSLAFQTFKSASRVTSDRFPSVVRERGKTALTIAIQDGATLFQLIGVTRDTRIYTGDARNTLPGASCSPFADMRQSDKGRYLNGFLEVFSGLSNAHDVLEQRYWRRVFSLMSRSDPARDARSIQEVRNKLRKLGPGTLQSADGLDRLAHCVLNLSKQQPAAGKELQYSDFVREAKNEVAEYGSMQTTDGGYVPGDKEIEEDLSRTFADLVELGVLAIGIRPKCDRCGVANWYPAGEIRPLLRCDGCGFDYPLRPEPRWYYRLNSLVSTGYAQHGLAPVALVLGQLLNESRQSFIWTTSWEFYSSHRNKRPYGDVDIACVQDGKLVIGEVKQSTGLFGPDHFKKMVVFAKRLRPDTVLFTSLESGAPRPTIQRFIEEARAELSKMGIDVRWYELSQHIFDPFPVR
ncbi:MAG TPA: hypothetical protein VGM37_11765 [Armatimonadota bacterium]